MKIAEKRAYPRITASFPVRITPDILGETVDISETGLGFVLEKPLLLSKATAKIELSPKESIDTEFKVIWNKHLVEKNGFRYGVCFIRLKEKDIDALRNILIQTSIEPFINDIKDAEKKQKTLTFWLKDFKKYMSDFDFLERDIKNKQISLPEGCKKLKNMTDSILQKADELEVLLNDRVITKKIKATLRLLCGPWAYQGEIVKRAFKKPRGYPGDYELLEMIYVNNSISEGVGYCCDKYFLDNEYANAVRSRKSKMGEILANYIYNNSLSEINILNLACGPCREIIDMFSSQKKLQKKVSFTLVDQDNAALDFSKKLLNIYESNIVKFKYLHHNILRYIKEQSYYKKLLGKYDMIYSIGLADYLPDRVLKNIILFCYDLLKPKGLMVLAHKDIARYKPLAPDWWCDWTFYARGENHLLQLVGKCGINDFNIKIDREKSGIILFLYISKEK